MCLLPQNATAFRFSAVVASSRAPSTCCSAQARDQPSHLLLDRLANIRLRIAPSLATRRDDMAVLADFLR